jgi:hypothetical protein
MMSALPQIPPIPPAQPTQLDAFRLALNGAGAALNANPDAIGKTLLSGIDGFDANEASFRTAVAQAVAGDPARTGTATDDDPASTGASTTGRGMTAAQALDKGLELERQSLGVMMQTYSFALEATLVSNAATTFTSSVNTLIKTQ